MEGKSINLTLSLPHKGLAHVLGATTHWPTSELTLFSPAVFGYSVWSRSFQECLPVWLNITLQWTMRQIPNKNIGSFFHLTDILVRFRPLILAKICSGKHIQHTINSFRECLPVWQNIALQWTMRQIPNKNTGSFFHLTDILVRFRPLILAKICSRKIFNTL